jgi:HlyD family secretion protein
MNIDLPTASNKKPLIMAALFFTVVLFAFYKVFNPSIPSVNETDLQFATVQQGPLDIYVNSFGEFASQEERLLTAPALGKVSAIMVRPGALVEPNTIIVKLINPQLEQQVSQADGALSQVKAQQAAYVFEQKSARLNYLGRIEEFKAALEHAELELAVHSQLLAFGTGSKIKMQRAQLAVKQSVNSLSFEQKKYQQFIEMQSHQLTQKTIEVEQQQEKLNLLNQQLSQMSVRAGLKGTLQTLEVTLGQSVNLGQSIAKVGSIEKLVAKIRLPQRQADQIVLGAAVTIDTQKGNIAAHITRIESLVTNGSVLAEATLDGPLTSNARPSLPISAKVFLEHRTNATHVLQSAGLRPNSKQSLFVKHGNQLEKREVTFGQLSSNQLIISHGLERNDIIVSSDMRDFQKFIALELVQ